MLARLRDLQDGKVHLICPICDESLTCTYVVPVTMVSCSTCTVAFALPPERNYYRHTRTATGE